MIKEKEKLNVLFLASWYPNRHQKQNGSFIKRHAEAVALNCKVATLHVFSDPNIKDFEIDARWDNNIFEVLVYHKKSSPYLPLRKFNNYLKAHQLGFEKIQKEFGQIDIVHLNVFYRAGIFALRLKEKHKIPFIITEHWTGFLKINPYQFSFIEKYYIKKIGAAAAMICPVSDDLKNAIIDFGIKGPYQVIPNVVDTNLFQSNIKKDLSPIKILHVSTLNNQHKNISGILNVVARLAKERQDFTVTLAGNHYEDLHTIYAKKIGIPTSLLQIKEEIPLEEIAALMQSHHIFILFSNYENLPCVISEAHISGMTVIATNVGGIREMIRANNGILIEAKDEEALYEQTKKMMDNYQKYDPNQIRIQAVKRYSYQSVADQYTNIYKEVLDKSAE